MAGLSYDFNAANMQKVVRGSSLSMFIHYKASNLILAAILYYYLSYLLK